MIRNKEKLGNVLGEDVGCVTYSINCTKGAAKDRGGWRDKELETWERKSLNLLL